MGVREHDEAVLLLSEAFDRVEQGEADKAEPLLRKALELDDSIADAHNEMCLVLCKQCRYDDAEKHSRKAVELEPAKAKFWNGLAGVTGLKGDTRLAIQHCMTALECDPNYPGARVQLSRLMATSGYSPAEVERERQQARAIYEQTGKRSDGEKLRPGDIERILTPGSDPRAPGAVARLRAAGVAKGLAGQDESRTRPDPNLRPPGFLLQTAGGVAAIVIMRAYHGSWPAAWMTLACALAGSFLLTVLMTLIQVAAAKELGISPWRTSAQLQAAVTKCNLNGLAFTLTNAEFGGHGCLALTFQPLRPVPEAQTHIAGLALRCVVGLSLPNVAARTPGLQVGAPDEGYSVNLGDGVPISVVRITAGPLREIAFQVISSEENGEWYVQVGPIIVNTQMSRLYDQFIFRPLTDTFLETRGTHVNL